MMSHLPSNLLLSFMLARRKTMSKDFPGIIYSSTLSSFTIFVRSVLAGKRILRVAVGVVLRLLGVDVVELK